MTATRFHLAIIGAGPVGLALANLLARSTSLRIVLIDARDPAQAQQDARTLALAHGSRLTLERAQAWGQQITQHATAIEHIHVSQAGGIGRTLLHHDRYGLAALGYVVPYGAVVQDLLAALPASVVRQFGNKVAGVNAHTVQLADGSSLAADIIVQAEGGLFTEQSHKPVRRDYEQSALVGTVKVTRFQANWAYERFTSKGPIALLPQADGYALVWCDKHDLCEARSQSLREGHESGLLEELQQAFGHRLGQFTHIGLAGCFALGLNAQRQLVNDHVVTIGNAAQTLHPVAGQGLNLGLRDAFVLAETLQAMSLNFIHQKTAGEPLENLSAANVKQALSAFARQRQKDRWLTVGTTDLLPRLFALQLPGMALARGLGLAALDLLPPLQGLLATQMLYGKR